MPCETYLERGAPIVEGKPEWFPETSETPLKLPLLSDCPTFSIVLPRTLKQILGVPRTEQEIFHAPRKLKDILRVFLG